MSWAYYNENDPFAAAWLDLLIIDGLIAPGYVDRRSIADVQPEDLKEFSQCHFFAGIGGWSYALRLAGVSDDTPVWTGSCPCQPFSQAGQRKGTADKRHLWPEFARLIRAAHPATIFGEQVASKDGREWLAGVFADLEGVGYSRAGADLCAAGVGAPHIRQRLYWMAHAMCDRNGRNTGANLGEERAPTRSRSENWDFNDIERAGTDGGVAHAERDAGEPGRAAIEPGEGAGAPSAGARAQFGRRGVLGGVVEQEGFSRQPWLTRSTVFIPCTDGKARRIEPSIFPLAHGVPNRMGTLRGSGNAIVPAIAAVFIEEGLNALLRD